MDHRSTSEYLNSSFVNDSLNGIYLEQIRQVYGKILGEDGVNSGISIRSLKDLSHLFGQDFEKDEWLICFKESMDSDNHIVKADRLAAFSEKISEETKIDPYNVLKKIIENEITIGLNNKISLKFLK